MTSQQPPAPLIASITKHLPLVEKVMLTALAIGTILTVMHVDSTVTSVSLFGLATTFFLMAYRPIDVPRKENERLGFPTLLGLTMVPKVLWISSAVSAVGIAFYLFNFEGYKNMLLIGTMTIGIGTFITVVFLASGVKHIKLVTPVLLRAVPLCLVNLYILFK